MTFGLSALPDAARVDLDRLCDLAYATIEARRGTVPVPDPEIGAALRAIADRLREAGVESRVADMTVTRWFITRQQGGARVPITECLAVELNPPYPTSRVVTDMGRREAGERSGND